MKKSVLLTLFVLANIVAKGQHTLYTIDGQPFETSKNDTAIVIYYSSNCCHLCMYEAIEYCQNWVNSANNRKAYILIDEPDIVTRRKQITCLSDYSSQLHGFIISFDLNPVKRKRFVSQLKIKQAPQIFIIYPNKARPILIKHL